MRFEERARQVGSELKRVAGAIEFAKKRLDPEHHLFDPEFQDHWAERKVELAQEHEALAKEWTTLLAEAEAELA